MKFVSTTVVQKKLSNFFDNFFISISPQFELTGYIYWSFLTSNCYSMTVGVPVSGVFKCDHKSTFKHYQIHIKSFLNNLIQLWAYKIKSANNYFFILLKLLTSTFANFPRNRTIESIFRHRNSCNCIWNRFMNWIYESRPMSANG